MNIDKMIAIGWTEKFDGDVVSPKTGDRFFIRSGALNASAQSGGECRAYGNATLNILE